MSPSDALGNGVLDLILNAGPIAKFVLGVLLVFSIVAWALIVDKWWQFRRVRRQTIAFLRIFREGRRASVVHASAKKFRESPLAQLYAAAYQEATGASEVVDRGLEDVDDGLGAERLEAAHRALRRAAGLEIARLERYLPFLATTASATPFIGLFGTVWGVMAAFHGIGQQGSASLAVVAPGISEALIATAAGLGAAIPAVIGYNYFVSRVKHWATEMDGFTLDLLNLLSRPAPKLARPAKDGI
ncbi:MAG: MotA/TolQ/ExbB proton channel family protein [Candidatus Rokubacteria bacterium]|nr:MotA/TolQ/ExbB proton channel family protein [Candidatus Rokubacteria bacterium]